VAPGIERRRDAVVRDRASSSANNATNSRPRVRRRGVPKVAETTSIADLEWRKRALVAGRVKTVRLQPRSEVPTLECVLVDDSGAMITLVFLGRRSIPGVRSGIYMTADGTVGKHDGKFAMINPLFELLSVETAASTRPGHSAKRRLRQ
jgi:hypothetical protein